MAAINVTLWFTYRKKLYLQTLSNHTSFKLMLFRNTSLCNHRHTVMMILSLSHTRPDVDLVAMLHIQTWSRIRLIMIMIMRLRRSMIAVRFIAFVLLNSFYIKSLYACLHDFRESMKMVHEYVICVTTFARKVACTLFGSGESRTGLMRIN